MDQDKEINITSRKGQKPSPASPARCAPRPSKAAPQPWELHCETGRKGETDPFHPFSGSADPR